MQRGFQRKEVNDEGDFVSPFVPQGWKFSPRVGRVQFWVRNREASEIYKVLASWQPSNDRSLPQKGK